MTLVWKDHQIVETDRGFSLRPDSIPSIGVQSAMVLELYGHYENKNASFWFRYLALSRTGTIDGTEITYKRVVINRYHEFFRDVIRTSASSLKIDNETFCFDEVLNDIIEGLAFYFYSGKKPIRLEFQIRNMTSGAPYINDEQHKTEFEKEMDARFGTVSGREIFSARKPSRELQPKSQLHRQAGSLPELPHLKIGIITLLAICFLMFVAALSLLLIAPHPHQ